MPSPRGWFVPIDLGEDMLDALGNRMVERCSPRCDGVVWVAFALQRFVGAPCVPGARGTRPVSFHILPRPMAPFEIGQSG